MMLPPRIPMKVPQFLALRLCEQDIVPNIWFLVQAIADNRESGNTNGAFLLDQMSLSELWNFHEFRYIRVTLIPT